MNRRLAAMQWFDRDRAITYGAILLGVELLVIVYFWLQSYGLLGPVPALSTDFLCFYAAGTLVNQGHAAEVYDIVRLQQMQMQIYGGSDTSVANFILPYPPTYLLICSVLARMPYLVAFYSWAFGQVALFIAAMRRLLGEWGLTIAVLSCPSFLLNICIGHNATLNATLILLATLLLPGRQILAGALLGLLSYKPHLLALMPVALIAGRQWKALAAMAVSATCVIGLSWLSLGTECWIAFLNFARAMKPLYEDMPGQWGAASLFSAAKVVGASTTIAYTVQLIGAAASAAALAWSWFWDWSPAQRAALLVAGVLMTAPVLMSYDTEMAAVGMAWLAVEARESGWYTWEKPLFAVMWVAMLVGRGIAEKFSIPLIPLIGPCLFALTLRRAYLQRTWTSASAR